VRDKLVTVRGSKLYLSKLIVLSIWTIGSLGVTIWLAIQPWNPIALFTGMLFLVTCIGWYSILTDKDGKEHDKAIADFSKAIELDPADAKAYRNRGLAYYYKREYDKAMADFNKAIDLNPEYAEGYYNRGTAYGAKGEYDKAIADFNKVIDLDPEYALAYGTRGLAYYYKGEYDKAIADYNKVGLYAECARAYRTRGFAYTKLGEKEKAISDFEKCIELSENPALTQEVQEMLDKLRA